MINLQLLLGTQGANDSVYDGANVDMMYLVRGRQKAMCKRSCPALADTHRMYPDETAIVDICE